MNGKTRLGSAFGALRESKWIVAVTVMLPTLLEIIEAKLGRKK